MSSFFQKEVYDEKNPKLRLKCYFVCETVEERRFVGQLDKILTKTLSVRDESGNCHLVSKKWLQDVGVELPV